MSTKRVSPVELTSKEAIRNQTLLQRSEWMEPQLSLAASSSIGSTAPTGYNSWHFLPHVRGLFPKQSKCSMKAVSSLTKNESKWEQELFPYVASAANLPRAHQLSSVFGRRFLYSVLMTSVFGAHAQKFKNLVHGSTAACTQNLWHSCTNGFSAPQPRERQNLQLRDRHVGHESCTKVAWHAFKNNNFSIFMSDLCQNRTRALCTGYVELWLWQRWMEVEDIGYLGVNRNFKDRFRGCHRLPDFCTSR